MADSQLFVIVDRYFSLQWCRENIVVPLGVKKIKYWEKLRVSEALNLATIENC